MTISLPSSPSQLMDILSMGFQNKFYNASKKDPGQASSAGVAEYRINVSSDTPHWYIRDYLARVSRHYDISAIEVDGNAVVSVSSVVLAKLQVTTVLLSPTCHSKPTDLDECKAKEAECVHPARCANTYGGYRCVCNGTTDVDETQSCVLGEDPSCRK